EAGRDARADDAVVATVLREEGGVGAHHRDRTPVSDEVVEEDEVVSDEASVRVLEGPDDLLARVRGRYPPVIDLERLAPGEDPALQRVRPLEQPLLLIGDEAPEVPPAELRCAPIVVGRRLRESVPENLHRRRRRARLVPEAPRRAAAAAGRMPAWRLHRG